MVVGLQKILMDKLNEMSFVKFCEEINSHAVECSQYNNVSDYFEHLIANYWKYENTRTPHEEEMFDNYVDAVNIIFKDDGDVESASWITLYLIICDMIKTYPDCYNKSYYYDLFESHMFEDHILELMDEDYFEYFPNEDDKLTRMMITLIKMGGEVDFLSELSDEFSKYI